MLTIVLDAAVYGRQSLPRGVRKFVLSREFPGLFYSLLIFTLGFMICDFIGSGEDLATRSG